MENIFKEAKFGDKFRRRDGGFAIYLSTEYGGSEEDKNNLPFIIIYMANEHHVTYKDGSEKRFHSADTYSESGKWNRFSEEDDDWDIVGKWEEQVDEKKLDILAEEFCDKVDTYHKSLCETDDYDNILYYGSDIYDAYEAGYRKAKEE